MCLFAFLHKDWKLLSRERLNYFSMGSPSEFWRQVRGTRKSLHLPRYCPTQNPKKTTITVSTLQVTRVVSIIWLKTQKEYFPKCQTIRLTTHVAFLYVAWKSIKLNVMCLRVWQLDSFISAAHIAALLASGSGVISSAAVWPRLLLGECLLR